MNSHQIKQVKISVINAYQSWIVRLYCYLRFIIINVRILEEIDQYLPQKGKVLDIGCGFGLFTAYFAKSSPLRTFESFDLNGRRIKTATNAIQKLGIDDRVRLLQCNVVDYSFEERVDAIYMLDIIHHIPKDEVPKIVQHCYDILGEGGVLIIKDIETHSKLKVLFTWVLDKAMDYKTPVSYHSREKMLDLVSSIGFEAKFHSLVDILPYPHIMYICTKKPSE